MNLIQSAIIKVELNFVEFNWLKQWFSTSFNDEPLLQSCQYSADPLFFQQTKLIDLKKATFEEIQWCFAYIFSGAIHENKLTLPIALAIICSIKKSRTAVHLSKPFSHNAEGIWPDPPLQLRKSQLLCQKKRFAHKMVILMQMFHVILSEQKSGCALKSQASVDFAPAQNLRDGVHRTRAKGGRGGTWGRRSINACQNTRVLYGTEHFYCIWLH